MAVISFSLFLHILCFISFLEKANKNINDKKKKKKEENNQNKAFSHSQELLSQLINAFVAVVVAFACFDQTAMLYCFPLFNKGS